MVKQQQEGEAGKGGRQECERPWPVLIRPGKTGQWWGGGMVAGGGGGWGAPRQCWLSQERRLRDGLGTTALIGPEIWGRERSGEDGEGGN